MVKFRQNDGDAGEEPGLARPPDRQDRTDERFDADGIPSEGPVSGWLDYFDPAGAIDPGAGRWLQAVFRFSRPDGSPVFGPRGKSPERLKAIEAWAGRLGDPSLSAVVARWLPSRADSRPSSAPPRPSDSRPDRALAVLRPDWSPRGDLVAIDHRRRGDETLVEVASRGQGWLGPSWTSGATARRWTAARPAHWSTGAFADGVEWSYKAGSRRVARSAVLLRGRSMALLGQQSDGLEASAEMRLGLGDGIEAGPIAGSRALLLSAGRGRPTARLIPLGLPSHDRATDLGSIAVEGREVVIRQAGDARRRWLPALICWGKAPTAWKPLTVAFRSKACRGEVAVASRVAFGPRDEGLVVYRSLAEPALRSFLGHQTAARFLVGAFTRAGEVRPIFKVDA